MAQTGPASQLRGTDADGMLEVAVKDGSTNVTDQPLLPVAGTDGVDQFQIRTDGAGNTTVVGIGTAGSQAGGVLTVQGDPAGTPIPVTMTPLTATTSAITRVVAVIVSTLIKVANANRLALILVNDSNKPAYVHFGAGPATVTAFTYKMAPGDRLDPETFGGWDGDVYAIWSPGVGITGAMQVTELTA